MNMDLVEIIRKLISLKQEGAYWDFKRQWYSKDKKVDLLHDIICMANNLENRDAYIIIGVDEENDYSLVDVKLDVNRKNTQKMVDFLRDKKFAGGVRPVVYVQEVKLFETDIDVIVIKNSYESMFNMVNNSVGLLSMTYTYGMLFAVYLVVYFLKWLKRFFDANGFQLFVYVLIFAVLHMTEGLWFLPVYILTIMNNRRD